MVTPKKIQQACEENEPLKVTASISKGIEINHLGNFQEGNKIYQHKEYIIPYILEHRNVF